MRGCEEQLQKVDHVAGWTASRVKEWRIKKGLTQKQLGDRLGVPYTRISDIESRRYDQTSSTLLRIIRALEISPSEFFSGAPAWRKAGKRKR